MDVSSKRKQQIPFWDDKQESKGEHKGNRRLIAGGFFG
jgi:hypothetical protein